MWKREINGEVKKNIPNKNKRRWSLFFLPFFLNWIKDSIKSAFQISLMLTSMGTMNGFRLWLFKTFKCLQPYSIIYIKNKLFCASMGIYTLCAHFSFTYICYYRFSFFLCVHQESNQIIFYQSIFSMNLCCCVRVFHIAYWIVYSFRFDIVAFLNFQPLF